MTIPSVTYVFVDGTTARADEVNQDFTDLIGHITSVIKKYSATTEPGTTEPLMWWFDSTNNILKLRNEADTAWLNLISILGDASIQFLGPLSISENSDTITISHDGTDASIKFSDGQLIVQTDEGTDTDTVFVIAGKGAGEGRLIIKGASGTNTVTFEVPVLTGDRVVTLPDSDVDLAGSVNAVGCLVHATANQAIANSTSTAILYAAEDYDDAGFHDNVTNPERITIPAAYDGYRVQLYACIKMATMAAGNILVYFAKGGTTFAGETFVKTVPVPSASTQISLCTPPILVATGDYFALFVLQNSGGPINHEYDVHATYFGLRVVGKP
jgi:hypothetical protein